jgi:EAL domain-containing protein (putative c-di-GMP-specific phosphodiesterase class I)
VRIAVDDAGAGISSLRHIVQLAPETIKLDISLTQGVGTSPLRRALAGALIDFAQRTDAELIVEGIEEISDLSTWTALGADAVQGFLVGRPGNLPVAQTSALIASLRGARV